ncbi:TlpA family protein disulfide reductase [Paenibacillus silviterrae]|uniref:TlpA family protein disulfide reductase n=1 Tax=Paenibacillus silviterrae TaxID=3242194 RepID=UPI002542DDAB|nr:TlpA disulfide reductase family protein [Paenibacillus chinjuensis]
MKKTIPLMLIAVFLATMAILQTVKQDSGQVQMAAAKKPPEIAIARPVPSFVLKDSQGKEFHVGGRRDKPLVVNFWASWCGPCHEEAPSLQQMYAKYSDRIDLYAVNVTKGDRVESAKKFAKQYGFTFPVLFDVQGKAADDYRLMFVPTSFLIDKNGNLVEVIHVLPPEELEKKIQRLIGA